MKRAVIASLVAFACASAGEVPFGTPFSLSYGERAVIGSNGLSVTFVDVQDSRCPRNVVCVWEGEVQVRMRLSDESRAEEIVVKAPGTATALGWNVEVREVTPEATDPPAPKQSYKATVVVERANNVASAGAM